ncbi:SRPBCC family protein [Streptomyces sp. NPDC059477]|uniref:SRPBCC family protein n=1 Tax=Streptomyces sp. NPDC059477 TaxID=3346847 RepID=UPI0036CDA10C
MELEVFIPVAAERLRAALDDPARIARALSGLQQEAGAEPVAGRLKVRVGGTTITYRGTLRVTPREDGSYGVDARATESRGTGAVTLALTLRLTESAEGTTAVFDGTATADGRVAELSSDAVRSAVVRLVQRFGERVGSAGGEGTTPPAGCEAEAPPASLDSLVGDADATDGATDGGSDDATDGATDEASGDATPQASDDASGEVTDEAVDEAAGDLTEGSAEPSLASDADAEPLAEPPSHPPAEPSDGPPAEAAHARRTMIGRSAEEVDHAPPRGRYAPVPAPQTIAPANTLRWAAPAAALALASAIVVTRALRKRR